MPRGEIAAEELFDLAATLVSIDSINPDLVPGSRGEGEVGAFVAEWARKKRLDVDIQETGLPGRPNVIATARGTGAGRSLMLNAHMDTVGVSGMENPFRPIRRDGRLWGRGSMDTKAALAAFMMAAAEARERRLRGDVILTAVVDEEYASAGTEAVVKSWKAEAAIVGEPTGLQIVIAHKGFAWLEIETQGVAAHGSRPDAGVDAIARMGRVLVALEDLGRSLASGPSHRLLGTGSVHASLISGGQELSSYPASCRLSIERRTIPGEKAVFVETQLRDDLARMAQMDPAFKAKVRTIFSREPMEISRRAPVVEALAAAFEEATGSRAMLGGMSAWMDSSLLSAAGIPAAIMGPVGEGLHGVNEWVDLASVRTVSDVALKMICSFCS
ncbi:MAG TPA: M20/M25/M40 family metallo-hydrolase [Spirochaetia bacterium]|nr:M20/M25/M40 family metallo-hydrolase [Spirochaetia bacterium]